MKNHKKKHDIMLILGILTVTGVLYLCNLIFFNKPAVLLEVTVNGTVVETLDLGKDTEITIHGKNGGTNQLVIEHGEAYIAEASCPDGVCVHQGKIHQTGEIIVCLPNFMIAKVLGE